MYIAWWWGDPHIRTLDGRRYTFNGLGEYILANVDNIFETQARTKLAAEDTTATVFSAFVASDLTDGSNRVQVHSSITCTLIVFYYDNISHQVFFRNNVKWGGGKWYEKKVGEGNLQNVYTCRWVCGHSPQ